MIAIADAELAGAGGRYTILAGGVLAACRIIRVTH